MPFMHQSRYTLINHFNWQRIILVLAFFAFIISFTVLVKSFWDENTINVPAEGGTYIEGSVGEIQPLNPWFSVTNDVNRDIVSLVFSGLLRYNPKTKQIEDDLATLEVSDDKQFYTLTLKNDIYWHDSTPEDPHPLTPEDVLFTFKTIQNPEFPNTLLHRNYIGVEIEKLDDRRLRFKLQEPYSFFASNLTLGILPERSFKGIPVSKLDETLDFGFRPIGAGPYSFKGLTQTELSTEVTLERFKRPIDDSYHLDRIILRVFPDYTTLLSDIRNLDGIRHVPRNSEGKPIVPRKFTSTQYSLPQYVALFFNLDRRIVSDKMLRIGLQLGTNKQEIVNKIGESLIVDTPLLEIDMKDWRYKFDTQSAQGALFESDWHLPEKVRLQRLLEMREANEIGTLKIAPIVWLDTGAVLTVTGSFAEAPPGSDINGLPISPHPSTSGAWIANLPTYGSTGSIKMGQNLIRLNNSNGKTIDSFYVWRTNDPKEYKRASEEQNLLKLFIESKKGTIDEAQRITVRDIYVENGMLRRRLSTDPFDIRVNGAGDKLALSLLTSSSPPQYGEIAKIIVEQWRQLGVHVSAAIPQSRDEFETRLLNRDFDVLLFGQSLLDNLDSFPYWHSSGKQKLTGNRNDIRLDAYNLSQYSSLEADSLLELIRATPSEEERLKALEELKEIIKKDVPAIFLYAPIYTFAYKRGLHGINLDNLSLHSDRFLTLKDWFIKEERKFEKDKGWLDFPGWVISLIL